MWYVVFFACIGYVSRPCIDGFGITRLLCIEGVCCNRASAPMETIE